MRRDTARTERRRGSRARSLALAVRPGSLHGPGAESATGQERRSSSRSWVRVLTWLPFGAAAVGGLALSGLACCSWPILQWLGLLVVTLGGARAATLLGRFEAPLLSLVAVSFVLASVRVPDRSARWLRPALAGLATALAVTVWIWSLDPRLLWAFPSPVWWLFLHRQQVLFVALALTLGLEASRWLFRRSLRTGCACPAGGSQPVSARATRRQEEHDV